MTAIYVVRHGNTFSASEPPRRIGARSDPVLTPEGIAQGEALGTFFDRSGIRFDRALAGPLQRTRATAELILARQHPPAGLEIASWLREIDHGVDEGARESEVVARLGTAALGAWDREGIPPPGWQVDGERRRADWRRFFADVRGGNVLLVTSNGVARFALLAAFPDRRMASLHLRTGALGVIGRSEGGLTLRSWNRRPDDPAPIVPL